jgi:DNA-binding Xre family transcriptional regulator
MNTNSEIIDQAKRVLGVEKDTELAALIGASKQNVQQARNTKSQTVTHKLLIAIIKKCDSREK